MLNDGVNIEKHIQIYLEHSDDYCNHSTHYKVFNVCLLVVVG
jgi:hypothetical protein